MLTTRWHLATVALCCVTLVFGSAACSRHALVPGGKVGAWELPLSFRGFSLVWLYAGQPELGPWLSWSCEAELLGQDAGGDVSVELFPKPLAKFFEYEEALGEKTFDACLGLLTLGGSKLLDSASIPSGAGEVRRWCRYTWVKEEVPEGDVFEDVFLLGTDEEVVKVQVRWWDVPKPWSREEALGFLERVKRAKR